MFSVVQNIFLPFWKLLAYMYQIEILETGLFNVEFKRRNCPSARSSSATNAIDSDTDIFNGRSSSVNTIG